MHPKPSPRAIVRRYPAGSRGVRIPPQTQLSIFARPPRIHLRILLVSMAQLRGFLLPPTSIVFRSCNRKWLFRPKWLAYAPKVAGVSAPNEYTCAQASNFWRICPPLLAHTPATFGAQAGPFWLQSHFWLQKRTDILVGGHKVYVTGPYRSTSLMRNSPPPLVPPYGPRYRPTIGS